MFSRITNSNGRASSSLWGAQYLGARQQAKQQERYQRQAQAAERLRFQQEQTSMRMRQHRNRKLLDGNLNKSVVNHKQHLLELEYQLEKQV